MDCTRIILIRHGETDWNAASLIQGQLDIPLNAHGREQARRLAQALGGDDAIDAVFTSDLLRALQTAQQVARAAHAPRIDDAGLRERHLGAFQGRTFAEIRVSAPAQAELWRRRDPQWAPPGGGETLQQFRQRVVEAVARIAARNLGRHLALVAHGGVLDVLYRWATGLGLQDTRTWQIPNAALNRVLWTPDSGLTLVGWADCAHLDTPRDEGVT